MIEIPNSFDLMTNMHHTNPQLVEISNLTQQNAQLRQSNQVLKFVGLGLILLSVWVIYRIHEDFQTET